MSHSSAFFCILTTAVVFGDRSKLPRSSIQLIVPLAYLIIPAWAQPILVKQAYAIAENHYNEVDGRQAHQDGVMFLRELTAQNLAQSIVLSQPSNQDSPTETVAPPAATLIATATGQFSPSHSTLSVLAYERNGIDDTGCSPDVLIDDIRAANIERWAVRPLAISAMSLNIFIICVLVATILFTYKKRGKKLCFGSVEVDDAEYPLDATATRGTRSKTWPQLKIHPAVNGSSYDGSYSVRPDSTMNCIKEEHLLSISPTPSPCSSTFPGSPSRATPRSQNVVLDDRTSFLSLEPELKRKLSVQSMRALIPKSSRASTAV